MTTSSIFISSVQKELADERRALKAFIEGDALLRRYFTAFLFEDLPAVLAHLDLIDGAVPTYAAVLLFGTAPQRFLITSEVKCMHFHGTEVRKPIPSYQIYKGTVFELVDQALDFVLSKIVRAVGTRSQGAQAPEEYELPRAAIAESIVNAVAHRDYASNASVQVMLFADRLEIWNPGELPPPLTMQRLREAHPSIPRNPLLADPLFLARYIEKAGTGTMDMIAQLRDAGLPEPEFRQTGGMFVQVLWRDWLTADALAAMGLNERQLAAMQAVRQQRRLTNAEYQRLTGASRPTAKRDLEDLVSLGLLVPGGAGRGAFYAVPPKRVGNGSNGSSENGSGNGSETAQMAQRSSKTRRKKT